MRDVGRPRGVFALLISFALLVGTVAGAELSGADTGASAAKKKCKKGFKLVKKNGKKKCKKKPVTAPAPAPAPTPVPASTVRATLTWSAGGPTATDVDLIVFDELGNIAKPASNAIASSAHSGDNGEFGPETFTDLLSPSTRQFTYSICMVNDNGTNDAQATLTYKTADGATQVYTTNPGGLENIGDMETVQPPGGYNHGLGNNCLTLF